MTVQTSQQFLRYSQSTKYIWNHSRVVKDLVQRARLLLLTFSIRLQCSYIGLYKIEICWNIILYIYIYVNYGNYILYLHIPSIAILYPFKWFWRRELRKSVALMASGSESLATSFGLPVLNSCSAGCPVLGQCSRDFHGEGMMISDDPLIWIHTWSQVCGHHVARLPLWPPPGWLVWG